MKMKKLGSLLLALAMCLSLSVSAMALSTPSRGVKHVGNLTVETVSGPYIQPRTARGGTYHYHAREEMNTYDCSYPFDCGTGVGNQLDINVDNAIGDVPLNVYIYYGGTLVEQYLLMEGDSETTYISSTDGSYLDRDGEVVVKPANGGNSVYWVTVYQHT